MNDVTLDDILALNEELAALDAAGIPLRLGPAGSRGVSAEALRRCQENFTLRANLGQPLESAMMENEQLPPVYRGALAAGLRSGQLAATLDGISRQATADQQMRSLVGRSFVLPLILLVLTLLGFVGLCLYYAPTLEQMYQQMRRPPSAPLTVLVTACQWLPYWATAAGLLVLGGCIYWRSGRGAWQPWVPGARRYTQAVQNANFANQLALLTEKGIPLAEGLPLAASVTGDEKLISASSALAEAYARGDRLPTDAVELQPLPPLLRWALTGDLGDQPLPEVLRFAETTYRHKAERREAVWRFVLPGMIGALLGGLIIFCYGLSLFVPYVYLLEDLSH